MGRDQSKKTGVTQEPVRLRRGFVDVADGQVHFRHARPATASKSDTPLVVLHPSPGSSLMLAPFIRAMSRSMPVIALDTRGNGDSDPLPGEPAIVDFAKATWEALDALQFKHVHLLGTHTGASIAAEAAILRPESVGKLILDNMGLWSDAKKASHSAHNSPRVVPDMMGSQLNWAWHYCRDQFLFSPWYSPKAENRRTIDLPQPKVLHDVVVEVLKAIDTYHMSYAAAAVYDKRARLPLIQVPTLVSSNERDPLLVHLDELHNLVKGSVRAVVGDLENDEGAAAAADIYRDFLEHIPEELQTFRIRLCSEIKE